MERVTIPYYEGGGSTGMISMTLIEKDQEVAMKHTNLLALYLYRDMEHVLDCAYLPRLGTA